MKRWIHSTTETTIYRNKRNPNKYVEVHRDDKDYEPVESSYDPTVADEYVVKIWYESDEPRRGLPSASEEVFFTVANSPSDAIEHVKREWTGPIDRIEIVDINPEDMDEDDYMEIPFEASTDIDTHLSGCSFDFDLGDSYDAKYFDDEIGSIFENLGLRYEGCDFRSVRYPGNKIYSQCGVDFRWSGSYDAKAIEDALIEFIDNEGGNFLGIDFYSLED